MSVLFIPPYTPFLYCKTGVYRGKHYFLNFALKHRLWVLVRTASLRCTHNLCFEQKYENNTIFYPKIIIFTAVKNSSKLHGRVIVMSQVIGSSEKTLAFTLIMAFNSQVNTIS